MAIEIERKFLVKGDDWRALDKGIAYAQGYLSIDRERTARVRIADDKGFLAIKGATEGMSRIEFDYVIPFSDAEAMLNELCIPPIIRKRRYTIRLSDATWEIDEFEGENRGLIVAEVELESEEQSIALPDWIGEEVTGQVEYYNSNLVKRPYSSWEKK